MPEMQNIHRTLQFFLIIALGLMLIAVPVYWMTFSDSPVQFSEIENRNLSQFSGLPVGEFRSVINELAQGNIGPALNEFFNLWNDREIQKALHAATSDQMPLRLPLASLARLVERMQIRITYWFLPDPAIPAALNANTLLIPDGQIYIQPPAIWDAQRRANIDERIENYRNLLALYPDTHFYVFYLERMAYAPYNPMNSFFPRADAGQSFQYFIENKPAGLNIASLRLNSLDEHASLFFRTDHHWNIRGAWRAYEIIYDMLSAKNPDLSPKLKLNGFSPIKGVRFCGSYARRTLYPCLPEDFEYADVTLPPHHTYVGGVPNPYGNKAAYLEGNFSHRKYAEHYAEFFGYVTPLVTYDFNHGSQRNLLIIGGSYTQAMQEFVAAHFNRTYVVDLREYPEFSLGEFINQYAIDDVLVVGDVIVYAREGWQINP